MGEASKEAEVCVGDEQVRSNAGYGGDDCVVLVLMAGKYASTEALCARTEFGRSMVRVRGVTPRVVVWEWSLAQISWVGLSKKYLFV